MANQDLSAKQLHSEHLGDGADSESELVTQLAAAERAYEAAWDILVSVKARAIAGLSPQARAALEIAGSSADLQVKRLGVQKFETAKALANVRKRQVRGTMLKRLDENVAELAKFRTYARAITAGEVHVDQQTRRKLVRAIGLLETTIGETLK